MEPFGILVALPLAAMVLIYFVLFALLKALPVIAVAWVVGTMIDRRPSVAASSDGKGTL